MRSLAVYIVDDESSARELLRNLLSEIEGVNVVGEAESVDEALPGILSTDPDVLFLDIQMPGNDGFVLLERLSTHSIRALVVFVTAFEKYAIQAIRSSALDYLLKPVIKPELHRTVESLFSMKAKNAQHGQLLQLLDQLRSFKKIKFRHRTGFVLVDPREILFCEADSNYSDIELEGGKRLTVSMNLGKVEALLPETMFCRISRSVIINIHFLTELNRKDLVCELVNSSVHKLPVSRKYLKTLEQACETNISIE